MRKLFWILMLFFIISPQIVSANEANKPKIAVLILSDHNGNAKLLATRSKQVFGKTADTLLIHPNLSGTIGSDRDLKIIQKFILSRQNTSYKLPIVLKKQDLIEYGKEGDYEYIATIIISKVTSQSTRDSRNHPYDAVRYEFAGTILDVKSGEYVYNKTRLSKKDPAWRSFGAIVDVFHYRDPMSSISKYLKALPAGQTPTTPPAIKASHPIIFLTDYELNRRHSNTPSNLLKIVSQNFSEGTVISANENFLPDNLFNLIQSTREDFLSSYDLSTTALLEFGKSADSKKVTMIYATDRTSNNSKPYIFRIYLKTVDINTGQVLSTNILEIKNDNASISFDEFREALSVIR